MTSAIDVIERVLASDALRRGATAPVGSSGEIAVIFERFEGRPRSLAKQASAFGQYLEACGLEVVDVTFLLDEAGEEDPALAALVIRGVASREELHDAAIAAILSSARPWGMRIERDAYEGRHERRAAAE